LNLTQFWHDPDVPEEIRAVYKSYEAHHPGWKFLRYDAVTAAAFIEERFTSREVAAFGKCAVPAMQADYFRLCALLAHAGWYADADSPCLSRLDTLVSDGTEALFLKRHAWGPVMNGLVWVKDPGHPFLAAWLEMATVNIESELAADVWTVTGAMNSTSLYHSAAGDIDSLNGMRKRFESDPACLSILARSERLARSGQYPDLLRGVRVRPLSDSAGHWREYVPMKYKETTMDWRHWEGSIFKKTAR